MKKNTSWITGLKGVSAVIIFIHHFALFFYPGFIDTASGNMRTSIGLEAKIARTPLNIFSWAGVAGVCIFFTISGFLIAYNFYKKRTNYDINYIIKRYFKLMIPVLLSAIIIFFIIKSRIFRTDYLVKMYDSIGLRNNYSEYNSSFVSMIWESIITLFRTSSFPTNPPMWTMKYELIYSIASVLLINVIGNHKNRYYLYPLIVLITLNSYFLCFILGIILCDLWFNHEKILNYLNRFDFKVILLIISLFLLSSTYLNQGTFCYSILNNLFNGIDYLVVFHSLGAAALILYFLLSEKTKKLFSKKLLLYLGKQSLYIYLFHWVILNTISMYIVLVLDKYLRYYQSSLISFIISSVILMFSANYFGRYISKITNLIVSKINILFSKNEKI